MIHKEPGKLSSAQAKKELDELKDKEKEFLQCYSGY